MIENKDFHLGLVIWNAWPTFTVPASVQGLASGEF